MTPVSLTSQLRALLIAAGHLGRPLAYSEYAALLGLNPRSWPHLQRVIRALKSIMQQDHRCGRPYASVAAVSLTGDTAGLPGKGFGKLARKLGRFSPHEDYRAFVAAEWQRFRAHCLALPALKIA
jgi:hypothetical protein